MAEASIRRWAGSAAGRSAATGYRDLVFTVATAAEKVPSLGAQTADALRVLDARLAEAGSDKRRILSATVYITDMSRKAEMNDAWLRWIDPAHAPQRACIGVTLDGADLVEITVVAVRSSPSAD